jgi:hypothetical protein
MALLILASYFSVRLVKRGLSKRYEPKAHTPWSALNEGEDPTL